MAQYVPISCVQHERLEYSVLRKIPLELRYLGTDGEQRHERVVPVDVATRDGAEWLTFRNESGDVIEIRLDAIVSFQEAIR